MACSSGSSGSLLLVFLLATSCKQLKASTQADDAAALLEFKMSTGSTQQQVAGAGSSNVLQVNVQAASGREKALSGCPRLTACCCDGAPSRGWCLRCHAVLCSAGAEWPHITCCPDANLQQRVCGLLLPGMGLPGVLPALGLCDVLGSLHLAAGHCLRVSIEASHGISTARAKRMLACAQGKALTALLYGWWLSSKRNDWHK